MATLRDGALFSVLEGQPLANAVSEFPSLSLQRCRDVLAGKFP